MSIKIEVINDGNIEQCRDLCNQLMAFQKSKAIVAPDVFDAMNFDTRMKKSYESTPDSHVAVIKDDGKTVGYIFSTIENTTQGDKSVLPAWAPVKPGEKWLGFYPEWDTLPEKCGCLNNLYILDEYKGKGLGKKLFDISMKWMKDFGVEVVFVYISNGNNTALDFYLKNGFTYSHDVFGGFIKAAYYKFK